MNRLPPWFRQTLPFSPEAARLRALLSDSRLATVCDAARCPNRTSCWQDRAAAFLVLGPACTRDCRFCAVPHSPTPVPPDPEEPRRLATAAARLGLRHVVVTSVTRDDLPDGGAAHFAAIVREIRSALPSATVEILVPDFQGSPDALQTLLRDPPDVFNHNIETVPRLYPAARPQASYSRSLDLLRAAAAAGLRTKSGLMLGLGETREELLAVLRDLRSAGVSILSLGQYLAPSPAHLPVARYLPPEEFADLRTQALSLGFAAVASAPQARSSYHASSLL